MTELHTSVDAGNSVVVVEHDVDVVTAADWVIDIGTPRDVAAVPASRTAAYLTRRLADPPDPRNA